MKQLTCEMCNSTDLVKQDGFFVCQNCGTKYSVEEAKKMMRDVEDLYLQSSAKNANDEELRNLYELARRAKTEGNSENAKKYYDQIVVKDVSSWEANFYSVYYQAMECKIGEIGVAAARVSNCADSVFDLIQKNITDEEERRRVVNEVALQLILLSSMLFNSYKKFYDGISFQIKSNYVQSYADNCSLCRQIVYSAGNKIVSTFGDSYGDIACACWKLGVEQHNILQQVYTDKQGNANVIQSYNEKIKKYDPTYVAPETNMGGCYVATCVYGSYDCPQVWTLRRYRDYKLDSTWYGRAFIKTYYAISPTIVKWFGETNWFKKLWRGKLDKMVAKLQAQGYEGTQYEDKIF